MRENMYLYFVPQILICEANLKSELRVEFQIKQIGTILFFVFTLRNGHVDEMGLFLKTFVNVVELFFNR